MILADVEMANLLVDDQQLQNTMKSMRAKVTDDPMVFTSVIPEQFQANELAPMIRINAIGSSYRGADNGTRIIIPRTLVSFWVKTLKQGEILMPLIDDILQQNSYELYDDTHSPDPDTGDSVDKQLLMFRMFYRGIKMK